MSKLIIFDVDGTLLNTLDTISYHVNRSFEKLGLEGFSSQEVSAVLGYSSVFLIESLLKKRGFVYDENSLKECVEAYHKNYQAAVGYLTHPYEGIVELLIELRALGYKLVALSNKPDHTLSKLFREIDFDKYFDYTMGQVDELPKKPDPYMVDKIIDKYQIDKKDAILVGDSEVDYQTALNAGLDFVAVSWGFRSREYLQRLNPKYIVDTSEELLNLIKGGE